MFHCNLTDGIPLVEQVDLLGLHGIAAKSPVMEGWTSPVELTGIFTCPDGIALLVKGVELDCPLAKLVALVVGALK